MGPIAISILLGLPLLVFYLYWRKQTALKAKSRERNLPYVSIGSFIVASLMQRRQEEEIKTAVEQHRVFGFSFIGAFSVAVAEPEFLQIILSKEFTSFVNRRPVGVKDKFLDHILSATADEKWKRLRSVITPTFSAGKVRRMKPLVDATAKTLLGHFDRLLENGCTDLDIKQLAGTFTMDTIMQVAFGVRVDSLADPNDPIIPHASSLLKIEFSAYDILRIILVLLIPPLNKILPFRFKPEAIDFLNNFTIGIVEQKRRDLAKRTVDGQGVDLNKASNFIELLLEAEAELASDADESEKKSSKYITNDELLAQCGLFLIAGYDTTATTISMVCYYLAVHPEIQEKLYQEIFITINQLAGEESSSSDPFEQVTFESLAKFEYLAAVINETLRISPPATATDRLAGADLQLETDHGPITIKKGDQILIPIYALHHDPANFPEPEEFRPERFLGEPTFHKYSYMPFGAGPRNCVARALGLLEAKIAIIHLVRKYRFSTCAETLIPIQYNPQNPLLSPLSVKLRVEKR